MSEKVRGYAHRVDVAPEAQSVWRALTETESLRRWCSPQAQIRGKPGGMFRASVDRVTELEAHIDVFDPSRRLRLIYMTTQSLPPAESVLIDDFILEPANPGTIVRLLGSGYPGSADWDLPYRRLRMGWQQAMSRLKVYIEKHSDQETS